MIKPGVHICNFHSREEWETKAVYIDPTLESIKAEKLAKRTANLVAQKQRHQEYSGFMAASIAGYEKVNKSPGSSLGQESHTEPNDIHPGSSGESTGGLITPLFNDPYATAGSAVGASASGVDIIHPITTPERDAPACKSRRAGWAGNFTPARSCERGASTMFSAITSCALALSPLEGVVTASESECSSLHSPKDLPTEGPLDSERSELVKRHKTLLSPKNLSSRATEHCMDDEQQSFSDKQCSICYREACHPFTKEEQSCFDKTVLELQERMGVSVAQAQLERHQCEVQALSQWCLLQGDVISKSGEFSPDRVVPHDTTASIKTTVENPILKARPDKSSPQQKLDIAEMVEAKLRQGIIEKSSAPWSSNCVVIRKDGKTRIAVDFIES